MFHLSIFSFNTLNTKTIKVKKVCAFFLLLISLFAIFEVGFRYFNQSVRQFEEINYPEYLGAKMFRLKELKREGKNFYALFLGDSTAEFSLAPPEFKNVLGNDLNILSIAHPMEAYHRIIPFSRYVIDELKCYPKHIIIGSGFNAFNNTVDIKYEEQCLKYPGIRQLQRVSYFGDNFMIWKYREVFFKIFGEGPPFFKSPAWMFESDGWAKYDIQIFEERPIEKQVHFLGLVKDSVASFNLDNEMISYARTTYKYLYDKGIDVTFILSPIYPDRSKFPPEIKDKFNEIRTKIFPILNQYNVRIIDCENIDFLNRRHFIDLVHLNQEGAMVFSKWLVRRIKNDWEKVDRKINN